jgi:hypothetical protein
MSKSFDDILKEGKSKAKPSANPAIKWKTEIHKIMESLHKLNDSYGNDKIHHLQIDHNNCDKCNKASFTLSIRDVKNHKKVVRFHQSKWKPIRKGVYRCDECKKGN